jgi:hypothetical protein
VNRPDLRTVVRYFLAPPLPGLLNGRAGRIVDLSANGARVELEEPVRPGEEVSLTIVSSGGKITVLGTILWCEIDSLLLDSAHDRYLAGIAFRQANSVVENLLVGLCNSNLAFRIEDYRGHDRYHVTAPLTASFGEIAPVSVIDLSVSGARISSEVKIPVEIGAQLRFQVDHESGPTDVFAKVVWSAPAGGAQQAGLLVNGKDEVMRHAIHRLCIRGEARIDLDSLKRKFDAMRAQSSRPQVFG